MPWRFRVTCFTCQMTSQTFDSEESEAFYTTHHTAGHIVGASVKVCPAVPEDESTPDEAGAHA
jgi:hypothetical protein